MKGKFRMGWLMVMFDLPVVEVEERRRASRFRNDLLDLGFLMLQESVYIRNCVTSDRQDGFLKDIKSIAPSKGNITAFYLTEKQWERAVNITLYEKVNSRGIKVGNQNPDQLTFW